jgi:Domain of unknown function (DUF4129)
VKKYKSEKAKKYIVGFQSAFSLFLLLLILPSSALAATLDEYRQKIETAARLTEDLSNISDANTSPNERAVSEYNILEKLRQSLPATEKIEWQGSSIETNNAWLQDKLNEYEKDKTLSKRQTVLSEIRERLAAIKQKLDELQASIAPNRTKDEDKNKLGEILRRDEYQKPKEEEKSLISRLMDAIKEWFRQESPDPSIAPTSAGLESVSFVLQIVLYAVILGAIGFLLYRFLPFFADRFNKKREKSEKKERVILGERIAADESSDNIFSEAERLAREGNLRGAIRKGYIALLCELSDRKVIGLSRHKTNRDYLRDVRRRRELHENMSGLTTNFERHWYGFDEAEEKDWEEFKNGYRKAVSTNQ